MGRMLRILPTAAACAVVLSWMATLPADGEPPLKVSAVTASVPPTPVLPAEHLQAPAQRPASAALASPFGAGPPAVDEDSEVELRERNRGIDPARLTAMRPQLAESLLHQVELRPHPRGGFFVGEVAPDSLAARLGLQRGDVLLTIDSPENAAIEESPASVLQQTQVALQVTRDGQALQLRAALDSDDHDDARRR